MTTDEFLTAAMLDARTAYGAYQSMRTEELLHLQWAFKLDLADATTPHAIAFGGGRLALIAFVLRQRDVTPEMVAAVGLSVDERGDRPARETSSSSSSESGA